MGRDYQGTKKRLSSRNEWQVKGVGHFLPCLSVPPSPLHSSLLPLASFFKLPRFSLSPYPRVLCVCGYFSVFICAVCETCPRENEDLWFSIIEHPLPETTLLSSYSSSSSQSLSPLILPPPASPLL